MKLRYKASPSELLKRRKEVFLERGLPVLEEKGFRRSPFSTAWFGYYPPYGHHYELCRIRQDSRLERLQVYIDRGSRYVKFEINAFRLEPEIRDLGQLKGKDGINFGLPPNGRSKTSLRPPPGRFYWPPSPHYIRFYFTRAGLERRFRQLGDVIERDMRNIDEFFARWDEENELGLVDWEGNRIAREGVT